MTICFPGKPVCSKLCTQQYTSTFEPYTTTLRLPTTTIARLVNETRT